MDREEKQEVVNEANKIYDVEKCLSINIFGNGISRNKL